MKNSNEILENIEHLKFDQAVIVKRTYNYERAVKFTSLGLGIFSMVLAIFLSIAFLFIGVAKFFSVTFSLPSIGNWLLSLPDVSISDAEGALTRLIIGLIFFMIYVVLSIKLIIRLVKTVNCFTRLCDIANSNVDHRKELLKIVGHVGSLFTSVIAFILVSVTTTGQLSIVALLTLIVFVIYFILLNVCHDLYYCYDVKENILYKKQLAVNLSKRISLLVVAVLLTAYCLKPQLLTFTENIIANYRNASDYKGTEFVHAFLLPWINWLLSISCVGLLTKCLSLKKISDKSGEFNFYGKTYEFTETANEQLLLSVKKKANGVIFYSIVLLLTDFLFCCFSSKGFSLPENIGNLALGFILNRLSVILLAAAAKTIVKTEEKEIVVPAPKELGQT